MDNEATYVQPLYYREGIDYLPYGFHYGRSESGRFYGIAVPFIGGVLGGLVASAVFPPYGGGYGYGYPYPPPPYPYYGGYGYPGYPPYY